MNNTLHPLYATWRGMKQRCYCPRHQDFKSYGGRGITVCRAWRISFRQFVVDVGERPSAEHTLERIKTDGNYRPGNVRWATRKEQSRNTRRNHMLTAKGKTQILEDWADELDVPKSTLATRLKRGWSDEETILGQRA